MAEAILNLQKNEYTVGGICGQSSDQLTKCDLVLILRSSLIIRCHLNAEWEIQNSTLHKPDAVWYEYGHLYLLSLRSWRGHICCAAPALMNKINGSCGKRFAGWIQEIHLACRVGTVEMLCSARPWTMVSQPKPISLELRENLQWGRLVPIKHPPAFLYLRNSAVSFIFSPEDPW